VINFTFKEFEEKCEIEALLLEDRLLRYISSPKEHDLAWNGYVWFRLKMALDILENKRCLLGQH
jgi:hypothetical protein